MIFWKCPCCNSTGSVPFTTQYLHRLTPEKLNNLTFAEALVVMDEGFEVERAVVRDHNRTVALCPRYEAKKNEAIPAINWNLQPL